MSATTHAQREVSTGTTETIMQMRTRTSTSCPEVTLLILHTRTPLAAELQPRVDSFLAPGVCRWLPGTTGPLRINGERMRE